MFDENEKNQVKELSKEKMANLQGGSMTGCAGGMMEPDYAPRIPRPTAIQPTGTYD